MSQTSIAALSSGRGGAGKGLRSTGLALQLAYQNGRYPEPLLSMLLQGCTQDMRCETRWAVVRVSGGCAPPASQFVNASAGPGRPPGHLLLRLCLGLGPGCGLLRYFPVYGWASALTGGYQLAGGVPPPATQLQRSLELLHT